MKSCLCHIGLNFLTDCSMDKRICLIHFATSNYIDCRSPIISCSVLKTSLGWSNQTIFIYQKVSNKKELKSLKLSLNMHKLASHIILYHKRIVSWYFSFQKTSFPSLYRNLHSLIPHLWVLTNQKAGFWYWDVLVVIQGCIISFTENKQFCKNINSSSHVEYL